MLQRTAVVLALLGAALHGGCTHRDGGRALPEPIASALPAHPSSAAVFVPASETSASLASLEGETFERVDVAKGEVAWISVPVGAREPRPVIVGVHGAGDRADRSCSAWRAVVAEHAFVVCPQSNFAHPEWANTFVWGSAAAIGAQADRAVEAVRARYGAWMSEGPRIYGGWSQGGSLAAQVVSARRGAYDRVVLVEVGHTTLDADAVAASFVAAGVERSVVACESAKCRSFAQGFERAARRRRLPARLADAGLRHHWFDEPVYRVLAPQMVWLVQDDARFAGLGAAVDARWLTD